MYQPNLKSGALPDPGIIAIEVLGEVANPQSWGGEGHIGSGMVPFERALVSSYRPSSPSIITFHRALRVSENDIAAFVVQHATFSRPTSSLPKISPCSPRSRCMALGLRS